MSAELVGIIAAAIALGTVVLASMRGLRQDIRDLRTELRGEMKAGDNALREEMKAGDNALREEMRARDNALREEMKTGFNELTARMVDIGDRLSKIEGIIEGMFWSSRNQPPDRPRQGVA